MANDWKVGDLASLFIFDRKLLVGITEIFSKGRMTIVNVMDDRLGNLSVPLDKLRKIDE